MTEHELFKEAVMQNMVDDAKAMRHETKRKKHPAARRILVAAACFMAVAAVTVTAIPEARAAVEEWVSGWFSTQDYLGEESETRTKEPTVEEITHKYEGEVPVTITNVGPDAYAQTLADQLGLCIDEVAYNGKTVYLTGWFTGQSGKFMLDWYTGAYAWNEVGAWIEGEMDLTFPDGDEWVGSLNMVLTDEMREIMKELSASAVYNEEGDIIANPDADERWQAYMEENGIRFTLEAGPARIDAQPLEGQVEAELTFREYYCIENEERCVDLFSADLGTVTIDADAYASGVQTSILQQSVALSGVHRVLIHEWLYDQSDDTDDVPVQYSNHDLDFSGVTLALESISFRPDDTELTVHVTLPESWTLAERVGVAETGLKLQFLLDGEAVETLFSSRGPWGEEPCYEFTHTYLDSTIPPSAWAAAKTLTIIPYTSSPDVMSAIDNEDASTKRTVEMLPGAVIAGKANVTQFSDEDSMKTDLMDEYAVTINLDDYR